MRQPLRPISRLATSLLLALLALTSGPALAQITHARPGQIKAANRRALREAERTDVPYKDSHLQVTREQTRRGSSPGLPPAEAELLRREAELPATAATPGSKKPRRKKQ